MGQMKKTCEVLVEKPEGKRQLRSPGYRWEDDIKIDLKETELKTTIFSYCANTPVRLELKFLPLIEPLLYLSEAITVGVDWHFVCFTASPTYPHLSFVLYETDCLSASCDHVKSCFHVLTLPLKHADTGPQCRVCPDIAMHHTVKKCTTRERQRDRVEILFEWLWDVA